MIRRRVLAAAVAAIISASATATAAEAIGASEGALPAQRLDVRTLFERAPGVMQEERTVEIIVARIGPDGKLIKACVNSEAAARHFLQAPVETLRTKKAEKQ